jgi:hypothetical protein
MNDLPPRKTLVMLYRSLQYAQTALERREIVQSARVVRQALVAIQGSSSPSGPSPLARRILANCAGQTLSIKIIARVSGRAYGGSTLKKVIKELLDSKKIERVGKGMYHVKSTTQAVVESERAS